MITPAEFPNVLFVDIETVAMLEHYEGLDDRMRNLWDRKAHSLRADEPRSCEELFQEQAGVFAEFGKVIVIGMGVLHTPPDADRVRLRVKCLANHDEAALLRSFIDVVERWEVRLAKAGGLRLCGHNGKEFDFPYLARRMLVNGLALPESLRLHGKKPWEIPHLDTMELWKFGAFRTSVSLDLLSAVFGVASSKHDINGSQVGQVYYQENDLTKVARYCAHDVVNTAQVLLRMSGLPCVSDDCLDIVA